MAPTILLATYGTRGDVEPVVALAVALRAAGAQVRVCAPPDDAFDELFARSGVERIPFVRSWRSWSEGETSHEARVPSVDDFVDGHFDATFAPLHEAAQGADLLVATGMLHFVAGSVAELTGVPHRFVVFSPSVLEPMPYQPLVVPAIDRQRAARGLPPIGAVQEYLFTDAPWLATDPALNPPDEEQWERIGARFPAWMLPDDRPLPAALRAFLEAGEAPVYVGFGSMLVPQETAVATIAAVRAHGRRAVVGAGWAGLAAIDDAEDCLVVDEVNQQALFRRVAAVVHHGGAGTTTAALRAGVPQVVVPQVADQPLHAARVAELGVGVAHDGAVPTQASLTAALGIALASGVVTRAGEVAGWIRSDGADEAAGAILSLVR